MPRPSDIVVVGAGIVGCAVAYELARRGASVQVVDGRRPVGMGATQASAGVLAPYIEADPLTNRIILRGSPDQVKAVKSVLRVLSGDPSASTTMRVISVRSLSQY